MNLAAGTGFVPTIAQPAPASGSAGIYLADASFLAAGNGGLTLSAANEVQVGCSLDANGNYVGNGGGVNPGTGSSITTTGGGSIGITTTFGDVNAGSNPTGFQYQQSSIHGTIPPPYYSVAPGLGGISTAVGNVTIAAGGNVLSYLPGGSTVAV